MIISQKLKTVFLLSLVILMLPPLAHSGEAPLIKTEVVKINAPSTALYNTLLDFDQYGLWNPWLFEASGDAIVGGQVWARLLLKGVEMTSNHTITQLEPSVHFCWRDDMWYSFMAGGERCRYIEQMDNGQSQIYGTFQFKGWFASIGYALYSNDMLEGMASELNGLKMYTEQ